MNYEQWEPIYLRIVRDFGYSVSRDKIAARILSELLKPEQRLSDVEIALQNLISENHCIIIGPCISSNEIKNTLKGAGKQNAVISSVGKGTANALDAKIFPNLVFTDLDGYPERDKEASIGGSIIVVHAHGDNIHQLKEFVPKLAHNVIPTCQCQPVPGIFNWGGFTDGDRAYCAMTHFNAAKVELLGFDLNEPCGETQSDVEIKKKKLKWARRIIEICNQ